MNYGAYEKAFLISSKLSDCTVFSLWKNGNVLVSHAQTTQETFQFQSVDFTLCLRNHNSSAVKALVFQIAWLILILKTDQEYV